MKCIFPIVALSMMANTSVFAEQYILDVNYAKRAPFIDGKSDDAEWGQSQWQNMNFPLIGGLPDSADFSGKYRLLWDHGYLYLNVVVVDDVLYDRFPNPLERYWDDDCVEIFIDEDASGGDHLKTYNAFVYHVALDGNVVDIGPDIFPDKTHFLLLNEHVSSRWSRNNKFPYETNWELKVQVHNDTFSSTTNPNKSRVNLDENKKIGFMLAYCDNDGSEERESFIGSHYIEAVNGDKNLGYKTADVFGTIRLVK